jgi:N-acyl-D-amino-acid deacylase
MAGSWTIRGGTLLDAEGGMRGGDLSIRGGRVARLARRLEAGPHDLDATGLAVSPGFIDLHCHSEFASLVYPRAESKVLGGVTTDVSGNCGAGPFPLVGEFRARREREWQPHGLSLDWTTAAEYFARLEAAPSSVNRALLVGHGAVRAAVVGYAARAAVPDERRRMRALVEEGLAEGAFGLSSGLIYPPGCYADADELADLAAVCARAGGCYTSHIRSEGARLPEAVEELLEVVARSGARGHLSHLKASGRPNWPKAAEVVRHIRQARARGLRVTADRYPYLASMTDLDSILLPDWAVEGGTEAELARLRDGPTRRRLADEVRRGPHAANLDAIRIAAVSPDGPQEACGRTLRQLADQAGRDGIETAFDLLLAHRTQVSAIHFSMSEENLRLILAEPYVAVASDAALRRMPAAGDPPGRGLPHPRAYGTAARFLGTYVRDLGLMDWPEGVRRLTLLPAEVLGLADRGRLAEGAWADLVLFDPKAIADRATYEHPWAAPAGIRHVFVNGVRVVADGQHTGAMPGRVLRRG